MKLTLTLLGPARLMGARPVVALTGGSLVVGRSPTAGWVLPDPERIVSKAHCRIDAEMDGFLITDTSTNGVAINEEPLGYGASRMLRNGDRLRLGDVMIAAAVEAAEPAMAAASGAGFAPAAGGGLIAGEGPFGMEPPAAPAPGRPADSEATAAAGMPHSRGIIADDWWREEGAPAAAAMPKTVDIPGLPAAMPAATPTAAPDGLMSPPDGVAGFLRSWTGIDAFALAEAVDLAGASLPPQDWQRFRGRLFDILRDRNPKR